METNEIEHLNARIRRLEETNNLMRGALRCAQHALWEAAAFERACANTSPDKIRAMVEQAMNAHTALQEWETAQRNLLTVLAQKASPDARANRP